MDEFTKPQISISTPFGEFSNHLLSNDRILFSGVFGIGKTYFLKKYFEFPEVKEKYNVFHLFPVNYQIATNEDIFELIKYDILYHLFEFDWVNINKEKFSKSLVAQSYLLNNGTSFISKIMKCIPLYGINKAGEAIETLMNIQKDFLEYYEQINKNDVTLLADFCKQIEQKKGSFYEFDAISEFIYDNLSNCNDGIEEEKHKKNVLIIDDLDRIDPEHIFRLLNIFSAHLDRDDSTNKFGFDKIIFVCDVENIRNIYAAKYGQRADFSGYIDKFFSSEVFHFNNKIAVLEFVKEIMKTHYNSRLIASTPFYSYEISLVQDILYLLVEGNGIKLRRILENVKNLKDKNKGIGNIGRNYYSGYTMIWMCYKVLGGQKNALIDAFQKAKLPLNIEFNNIELKSIASVILPLLKDEIYNEICKDGDHFSYAKNGIEIKFLLRKNIVNPMYSREAISTEIVSPASISYNTLQSLLIEAVNILDKKGLLN